MFTPCPSAPVVIQFFTGNLKKIQRFRRGNIKKVKFTGASRFSIGQLTKIYVQKMQKLHKTCCYFGQNQKCKGSISPSNFHGQLPNILFACLRLCVRILRIIAVILFQNARGLYYFLVWGDSKFYARRELLLNICVERDINSIWEC